LEELSKSQALIDHVATAIQKHVEADDTPRTYQSLAIISIEAVTEFLVSSILQPQVLSDEKETPEN
jgi:hypothetical protein